MNGKDVKANLTREIKQSPVKAGLLLAGLAVALIVWVPRLTSAGAQSGPSPADAAAGGDDPAVEGMDLGDRDSLAIRAEFIAISKEARALRGFAVAVAAATHDRDPFHESAPPEPEPEPEHVVDVSAAEAAAEPVEVAVDPLQVEKEAAAGLRLTGVLIFPRSRRAVIDGATVAVGDRVAGFVVVTISEREVVLRGDHGVHALLMRDPLEKEDPR